VSLRRLQLTLLVVAAAALVIMFGVLPLAVRLVGLGVVLVGTASTAAERHARGGGWWVLLAGGALLSLVGLLLSLPAETAGGIVAIVGAALVVIAATVGFPLAD
jgi:hypothetical protein